MCASSNLSKLLTDSALKLVQTAVNLHVENQKRVGLMLLDSMKSLSSLNEFGHLLLIHAASMEEQLAVCVRQPLGSSFLGGQQQSRLASSGPSQSLMELSKLHTTAAACAHASFSPELKGSAAMTLLENNMLAHCTVSRHEFAVVDVGLSETGCFAWEYKVEHMQHEIHVGLTAYPAVDGVSQVSSNRRAYMMSCQTGNFYKFGAQQFGATKLRRVNVGDVIRITFDLDEGSLTFQINQESPVTPFTNVLEDFPTMQDPVFHPCLSICCNAKIRLVRMEALNLPEVQEDTEVEVRPRVRLLRESPLVLYPVGEKLSTVMDDFRARGDRFVWYKGATVRKGEGTVSADMLIRQLAQSSQGGEGQVLDLCYRIKWGDEDLQAPAPVTLPPIEGLASGKAPILRWIAANGGLPVMVKLIRARLPSSDEKSKEESKEDTAGTTSTLGSGAESGPGGKKRPVDQITPSTWWQFLRSLEAYLNLPGYGEAVMADSDCMSLLLHAMGVDGKTVRAPEPKKEVCEDPVGVLLQPLASLFRDSVGRAAEIRKVAIESGTVDCLLIQLGKTEVVGPRDPDYVEQFEDPAEVKARKDAAEKKRVEAEKKKNGSKQEYWAAGTGYGFDGRETTTFDEQAFKKKQARREAQTKLLLRVVENLVAPRAGAHGSLPPTTTKVLGASSLIPVLESYLRSTELDITTRHELYNAVYDVIKAISQQPQLLPLLDKLPERSSSIAELLNQQGEMAEGYLEALADGLEGEGGEGGVKDTAEGRAVMQKLVEVSKYVNAALEASKAAKDSASKAAGEEEKSEDSVESLKELYSKTLRKMAVEKVAMQGSDGSFPHWKYSTLVKTDAARMPRATLTRVGRELRGFRQSLPIGWTSSIIVRYDAKKPYVMQAMIFPPDDTPYDSGAFRFDLYCHPDYPSKPPKVSRAWHGTAALHSYPFLSLLPLSSPFLFCPSSPWPCALLPLRLHSVKSPQPAAAPCVSTPTCTRMARFACRYWVLGMAAPKQKSGRSNQLFFSSLCPSNP